MKYGTMKCRSLFWSTAIRTDERVISLTYLQIIMAPGWLEIKQRFSDLFSIGVRSLDGLTSKCYRLCRELGMTGAFRTRDGTEEQDWKKILIRLSEMSTDLLAMLDAQRK